MQKNPHIPQPDELFNRMAIAVAPHECAQYILGDEIDGYYDGRVHCYSQQARYIHRAGYRLRCSAVYKAGVLQHAERDTKGSRIYPFGPLTSYRSGCTEQLLLHGGFHAVSLRVADTRRRSQLSIMPIIRGMQKTSYRGGTALPDRLPDRLPDSLPAGEHLLLRLTDTPDEPDCPGWAAVTVDRDCRPEWISDIPGQLEPAPQLRLNSMTAEKQLTVTIAFAADRAAAAQQLIKLAAAAQPFDGDPIRYEKQRVYNLLTTSFFWTDDDPDYSRAVLWAVYAANTMVVHEFGTGIWAGLPWFKDYWGRDTFITLPGALLVTGRFAEARAVILSFSRLQCTDPASPYYGRVPNRVTSLDNVMYNTTDGTPWLLREIMEYLRYTGDIDFAHEIYPAVEHAVCGALKNYVDAEGFLTHHAADTWMDAKFQPDPAGNARQPNHHRPDADGIGLLPWSDRGSRAVEIQVLWHTALETAVWLARQIGRSEHAEEWVGAMSLLERNFSRRFWSAERRMLADRLRRDDSQDWNMRPNQLMAVTLPFERRLLPAEAEQTVVESAVPQLVLEHGVLSLSPHHRDSQGRSYFHPYHDNRSEYHKDAAYHNGAIWHWNAGFAVSAMVRCGYANTAWRLTRNLTDQLLYSGARGTLSENMDALPAADGSLTPSGTFSQAWSVSEFARNAFQDYLGLRPNLLEARAELIVGIPESWNSCRAVYAIGPPEDADVKADGRSSQIQVECHCVSRLSDGTRTLQLELLLTGLADELIISVIAAHNGSPEIAREVQLHSDTVTTVQIRQPAPRQLPLAKLEPQRCWDVLQNSNVMQKLIEADSYE